MSKYAKINSDNIVENIVICDDQNISSLSGNYVKVTDSTRNAEINYTYDSTHEKFIRPKIYDSWVFNDTSLEYEAPTEKPSSGEYYWNEEDLEWTEVISGISE